MEEVKKHIQNWKDIRIADISKLCEMPKPALGYELKEDLR